MATSTNGMGEAREDFDDVTLASDDGPNEEKEKVGLAIFKDDQLGEERFDAGQLGVDFCDVPLASDEKEEKEKSKIEFFKEDPIVQDHSNAQRPVEDSDEVPLVRGEAKLDAFGFGIDDNRGDTKKEKSKMRLDKTTQTQVEAGNHPTDRQVENDEDEDWQCEKFLQDKFSLGGEVDTKTKINIGNPPVDNDENEDWQYEKFLQDNFSQDVWVEVVKRTEILTGNTEKEVESGEYENGDLGRWEEESMSKEEKAAWRKIFRKKREKRWSKRQI